MKAKQTVLLGGVACGTLAILGGLFVPDIYCRSASAVMTVDKDDWGPVQFTFDSTLSMVLSDTNLTIGDLVPGNNAVSDELTITTTTTNTKGYVLTAQVGTTNGSTALKMDGSEASILSMGGTSGQELPSSGSTGLWGYSVGSNQNYEGFVDTSPVILKRTTSQVDAEEVKFKIGAYVPTDQPSGTYTNEITFISTVNVNTN